MAIVTQGAWSRALVVGMLLGLATWADAASDYQDARIGFHLPSHTERLYSQPSSEEFITKQSVWNYDGRAVEGQFRLQHVTKEGGTSARRSADGEVVVRMHSSESSEPHFQVQKKPILLGGRPALVVRGEEPIHITARVQPDGYRQAADYWETDMSWIYLVDEADGHIARLNFNLRFHRPDGANGKLSPAQVKETFDAKIKPVLDSVVFYDAAHPAPNPEGQNPTEPAPKDNVTPRENYRRHGR